MKAAVFLGNREVELRDFPDPSPGPGEVVVALRASGLCGSDLHNYRDAPGTPSTSGTCVVGHEPAGVVCEVGPGLVEGVATVGDRVIVHHYAGCTYCDDCRSGWPQMCATRPARVFGINDHGGHAPYIRVPAASLVPLTESLSFQAGAAIGCGTGTAWGALARLGDIGGSTLAIFGQGPVGLSATMLATERGARVIAIDPEPARLARARQFGAIDVVNPADEPTVDRVRELTEGAGAALIVETSGSPTAARDGLAALSTWGRMCLVGLGGEVRFNVSDHLRSQATLMTSWTMSLVQMHQCADFIARRGLPIDDIYTHRWPLKQVKEAYREFDKQPTARRTLPLVPRPESRFQ